MINRVENEKAIRSLLYTVGDLLYRLDSSKLYSDPFVALKMMTMGNDKCVLGDTEKFGNNVNNLVDTFLKELP